MRHLATVIALGVGMLTNGTHAVPDGTLLFSEFKTFCVDTRAKPEAVRAAIEAAGGQRLAADTATSPFLMTTTSWDHVVGDHHMRVSAATQHVPATGGHPIMDTEACTVSSFANEDASIALIRKWAGVPESGGQDGVSFYDFQEVGGSRQPIESNSARAHALAEGRAWHLTILQTLDHASVQLTNFREAPN